MKTKKTVKKTIAVFVAALALVSFTACTDSKESAASGTTTSSASTQSSVTETPATTTETPATTTETPVTTTETPVASSNFDSSREITVVSREDGSGTRGAFIELMGIQERGDDGTTVDKTTREAIIADSTNVMMTNIANDPYAIGYISLGSLNDTVKGVNIDGVAASVANIKNGSYAVQRPFNIAWAGDLEGVAKDFYDYIFGKEGQDIVARGYITVDENAPEFSSTRPEGKIVINGSSSVYPLMERLVEAYLAINENAAIELHQTDSSSGMTAAINGSCDIGMASRELREAEMADLNHEAIAIDGIAVIVNNDNGASNLTSDNVRQIFIGEITTWGEL